MHHFFSKYAYFGNLRFFSSEAVIPCALLGLAIHRKGHVEANGTRISEDTGGKKKDREERTATQENIIIRVLRNAAHFVFYRASPLDKLRAQSFRVYHKRYERGNEGGLFPTGHAGHTT